MKKRRVHKLSAGRRPSRPPVAPSLSRSQEQAAQQDPSEHPLLTLQRQVGNARVARLLEPKGAERKDSIQAPATLVQRAPNATSKKGNQAPASRPDFELWVLDDVLNSHSLRSASGMASFEKLYMAIEGKDLARNKIADRDRRELFDQAILELKHVIDFAPDEQKQYLQRKRGELLKLEAFDRVDSALTIGKKVVEMPGDLHPRDQAAVFRQYLPTLRETIQIANEQVLRLGEHELEHALEHIRDHGSGKAGILGKLAALNGLLGLADGWLTLSDAELQEELPKINQNLPTVVTNFAELLKAIVEIGVGAVSLTASLAAGIAKLSGDVALTESAMGVAAKAGHVLGSVVAGIEIVHGLFVLLNPKSTTEQKEKAAFGVASGAAYFIGGGAASFGVLATYIEVKVAAQLYWEGATGLTHGLMSPMWEWMSSVGSDIAKSSEHVANANFLLLAEKDPTKAKSLAEVSTEATTALAMHIDFFLQYALSSGKDMGWGGNMADVAPGNIPVLAEAFAPLQRLRKVKSGPELLRGATQILNLITWCLKHREAIEQSSMRNKDLNDIIDDDTKAAKPTKD